MKPDDVKIIHISTDVAEGNLFIHAVGSDGKVYAWQRDFPGSQNYHWQALE